MSSLAAILIVKKFEENVANLRMLFPIVLAFVATTSIAQVEMRLAYMTERPATIPAVFPNDQLFKFMTSNAYIGASELKQASLSQRDGRLGVTVRITEAARRKFNRLAAANLKTLAKQDDEGELVGIALLFDGRVQSLIHSTHRLPSAVVVLDMGDVTDALSDHRTRAHSLAQRINESSAGRKPL